jgi:hypothetical protein
MWWLYFEAPEHHFLIDLRTGFTWGYGHFFIFAAAAAVGVGIEAAIDYKTDHSDLSSLETGLAIAIPVAIYVLGVWFLHRLRHMRGYLNVAFPACAVLVLAGGFTPTVVASGSRTACRADGARRDRDADARARRQRPLNVRRRQVPA